MMLTICLRYGRLCLNVGQNLHKISGNLKSPGLRNCISQRISLPTMSRCLNTSTKIKVKFPGAGAREKLYNALDGWVGITLPGRYRVRQLEDAGHILLNSIYMKVDFPSLRKCADLEDTFEMWLQIVYLHVWMLLVKLANEGRDGKIISKALVMLMWKDIDSRLVKIQNELEQNLEVRKTMKGYNNLLRTSFLMYDEGLMKNDCELAGSIWNQIYGRENVDPKAIESLVHYIRFAMARLDGISMGSLVLDAGKLQWPLPSRLKRE